MDEKLLERRHSDYQKAANHQEGEYVPVQANSGSGLCAYAGVNLGECIRNRKFYEYVTAVAEIFDEMYADTYTPPFPMTNVTAEKLLGGSSLSLSPDGTSVQATQKYYMYDTDYPQFIENHDKFISDTLLKRKYPHFFTDPIEKVAEIIKAVTDDTNEFIMGCAANSEEVFGGKYSMIPITGGAGYMYHPLDLLFDSYRGIKDTLIDLRRMPEKVEAAVEVIWQTECDHLDGVEVSYPYVQECPHIPTYLNRKQYERFFWPRHLELITNLSKAGNKAHILLEGRWQHINEYFLDAPKDSCIIHVDDDDPFEVYSLLGERQTICCGLPQKVYKYSDKNTCLDYVRNVFDTMASGGGFIFSTNKSWETLSDVNQNLIDCYNFAHEYGKY